MTAKNLYTIIGANIRCEREKINMTQAQLAEQLGLSTGFVGAIERGDKGTALLTLYKLSEIFPTVPIGRYFLPPDKTTLKIRDDSLAVLAEDREKRLTLEAKRAKISAIITNLKENELDFMIQMIKNLKDMHSDGEAADPDGGED